jgi:hypothetical protein
MNRRKDTYRAALGRDQAGAGSRTPRATTLSSRYVRITIEVDPVVHRSVERWVRPPVALLTHTGAAALRLLTAVAARQSPPGARGSGQPEAAP